MFGEHMRSPKVPKADFQFPLDLSSSRNGSSPKVTDPKTKPRKKKAAKPDTFYNP